MSFSGEVKEELIRRISPARHCQLAEFAAIVSFCGQFGRDAEGRYTLGFQTENAALVKKGFTLLKKLYNIESGVSLTEREVQDIMQKAGGAEQPVDPLTIQNTCCKRAFLRGAFLAAGSMSDPRKGYHLEFVCGKEEQAIQLQQVIHKFDMEAKIILRKKYYVVYLKDGSAIVDLLNVCEAPVSLMNLENTRIIKEMRNSVNRRVNCETANISKTVNASTRQIEDIEYIREHYGFGKLSQALRAMAEVRLENPDAPLKELGEYLTPTVGKSGVNHRLRKLSELADRLRSNEI
ncbi:MAG: DNA-binding protein WhiA [Lachnospiraceae bacterium]|nr:DNA-binding protein WhiA [Butyrivibrio sp.]MCM1305471.1 DNA-binding protein WhiA [Butyrivibrio sp.]MCM1343151.1 DNA-binding protein WhiA [Muribaculaceae bacterium]MCM1411559.1 DNA-binding protein WhiA [Lachnospiraceae bacterium]